MQAEGARTKAGTWAPNEEEAQLIEMIADKDEEWEESLKGKDAWINKPAQPPGLLRTGARPIPLCNHFSGESALEAGASRLGDILKCQRR